MQASHVVLDLISISFGNFLHLLLRLESLTPVTSNAAGGLLSPYEAMATLASCSAIGKK